MAIKVKLVKQNEWIKTVNIQNNKIVEKLDVYKLPSNRDC